MSIPSARSLARLASVVLLVLVAVGLVACGPTASVGTLDIVVTGLPEGVDADIAVGTTAVTGSTSLELTAGTYQVEAESVIVPASIMGDRLSPSDGQIDATVSVGQTTTVTIAYAVAQEALLLVPNYGDGTIEVLTSTDLVAAGEASSSWSTDAFNGFTGMALGPDGRLYLADYSNDAIVVVDGGDLASNGTVTPAAVITNVDLSGPMGGGFDSQGNLWVASYDDSVLLRFDDVLGVTGPVDLAPTAIVTVDAATFAAPFSTLYDLFVDHLDNVWVTDYGNDAIYRFGDVDAVAGSQAVVPDLYLASVTSAVSDSGNSLYFPISLVVDLTGTLYVGNYDFEVSRFDDALSLTGAPGIEATAYLDTTIDFPYMVALDQSGALWVGHSNGELTRLQDPSSYAGYADVSGDLDLTLSWVTSGGTPGPDGGTMTFVPTQGPLAGF